MRVLTEIFASPWAIRPEALAAIVAMAERTDIAHEVIAAAMHYDPQQQAAALEKWARTNAVAQRAGTPVERTTGLLRRGGTAVLPIKGPIVRYGSMFTNMSGGGATVETLAQDLTRALEDESFTSILLDVDSPGGEASGIGELAQMILEGRSVKPITAYVSDLGASAGYWLASAASEIVIAPTAAVGSIGVVMAMRDPAIANKGIIEFVSSASPHKRPDVTTESGKAQIQGLVDTLGELFVDAVAAHRAVARSTVLSDFGQGGLIVGQAAVDCGMADSVGSFEKTLSSMAERMKSPPVAAPVALPERSKQPPKKAALSPAESITADLQERTPEVAAAVASSLVTEALSESPGAPMSNLMDRLRALVAEADVPTGSADTEAAIVTANLNQNPQPQPTALPAAATAQSSEVAQRLARLETENARFAAENTRLRTERIVEQAQVFASEQQMAVRALAPEMPTIVALYTLLASDDEVHGPVLTADGTRIARTTFLAQMFAARPSRKDLTDDMLGGVVTLVLSDRAAASSSRKDPNAPPDATRMAELLSHTSVGRDVLSALEKSVSASK